MQKKREFDSIQNEQATKRRNLSLQQTLMDLVKSNDLPALQQLVHGNVHLLREPLNKLNQKAIHIAAKEGFFETVDFLLKINPSSINEQDAYRQTPLICAASRGHTSIVKLLINQGAGLAVTINAPDDLVHGFTALKWATLRNYHEVVKILSQAEELSNMTEQCDAIVLLQKEKKNADWLLSTPKIRQLLEYAPNASDLEKGTHYYYKLSGRRPSFCLGIDWDSSKVTDFHASDALGKGAYGSVRKFSSADGKTLAVKKFPAKDRAVFASEDEIDDYIQEGENEAAFIRQADPKQKFAHHFYGLYKDKGKKKYLYSSRIIMPVVQGELAKTVFKKTLSMRQAVSFILLMTAELISLHEKGIIHGDIKADNVFIDELGSKATFIDFGISYAVTEPMASTFTDSAEYMAPERIRPQQPLLPHTNQDVFSFGVMLKHLICLNPTLSAVTSVYQSIGIFIPQSLKKTPEERPTLQSFYEKLNAEYDADNVSSNMLGVDLL